MKTSASQKGVNALDLRPEGDMVGGVLWGSGWGIRTRGASGRGPRVEGLTGRGLGIHKTPETIPLQAVHRSREILKALIFIALCFFGCRGNENKTMNSTVEPTPTLSSPYSAWSNGPSTDENYFPIGVWLQAPKNAEAYRNIGINTYVGLWKGPTEEQLAALKEAGLHVICAQNEVGLAHVEDPTIIAWMHGDEPDNAQRQEDGSWGGPVPVADIAANYQRLLTNDPTRPVWLNLGQGVANDEWVGRAATFEDYPGYVAATDIVSFDVYPISGIRKDDGENYLWYVAKGIERLLAWAEDKQTVWNVIETTRINSERGPTPAQVEAQVWMSLIHGSRGIIYFAHEWNPAFREARLLEDEKMRLGVAAINAQIHQLAPALNAPALEDWGQVTSAAKDIPIAATARRSGEDLYLFAVPMRLGTTRGEFTLPELSDGTVIEVIGENRQIQSNEEGFTDDFAIYQVHRYRIVNYFAP